MRAHVRYPLTLTWLCCLISSFAAVTMAQTTVNASPDPWDAVQSMPSRTELEVQLDDGIQLRGKLLVATAGMIRLSRTDEIAEVQRNRVLKVYQLSPKSDEFRRMLRGAGTITGVAAGLEIAKDKPAGYFLVPALGGTLGAFGGYAVGNRMRTRLLIYDVKPRQVTESPSSKSANPQPLTRPRIITQSLHTH